MPTAERRTTARMSAGCVLYRLHACHESIELVEELGGRKMWESEADLSQLLWALDKAFPLASPPRVRSHIEKSIVAAILEEMPAAKPKLQKFLGTSTDDLRSYVVRLDGSVYEVDTNLAYTVWCVRKGWVSTAFMRLYWLLRVKREHRKAEQLCSDVVRRTYSYTTIRDKLRKQVG